MCQIEYGDIPANSFTQHLYPHARKEHRCHECSRVIDKGEQYTRIAGVNEDGFWTVKQCEHCTVASEWVMRQCGGVVYTMLGEDMRDHAHDYKRRDLWRIVVGMKWKWRRNGKMLDVPAMPGDIVKH